MSEQEQQEQQEEKKEEEQPGLKDQMFGLEGSPSPEQVEAWKGEFGDVYVSGFSPTEIFVWRSITRPEWVQLQEFAGDPKNQIDQYKFEELVCDTCILWKSVQGSWDIGKAGTPSSLQEQILQNSNFVSPQHASMLVQKL